MNRSRLRMSAYSYIPMILDVFFEVKETDCLSNKKAHPINIQMDLSPGMQDDLSCLNNPIQALAAHLSDSLH